MADDGSEDRGEQFADRLVDVLNGGMLALMTSIGHRTGLFDVLALLGRERTRVRLAAALRTVSVAHG